MSVPSSANSSDKLSMPRPGGHVTTGGVSTEHVVEISTSVGSMDQFDWFKDYNVGFVTSSFGFIH